MAINNRIAIVDSLKGFALLGVILILFIEDFNFSEPTASHFLFSSHTDTIVIQTVVFFLRDKAWYIFALLFGFSFYVQMQNKIEEGIDYKYKLLWRQVILLIIGFIHSLVYKGDILQIYAIFGIFLVLFSGLSTKLLTYLAVIMAIQIPIIFNIVLSFSTENFLNLKTFDGNFLDAANNLYANGSFIDAIGFNLWKGRTILWSWILENSRYLQLMTLFISGILIGRIKFFEEIEKHNGLLVKILIMGILLVALFKFMIESIRISEFTDTQKDLIVSLISSWSNLVFTMVIILIYFLIYLRFKNKGVFKLFAQYGQMSLTNYVFATVSGVIIFYGFGLEISRYIGATWSLILGFGIFLIQIYVSKIWLNYFNYGPLEWLWRALTFTDIKIRFKKKKDHGFVKLFNS